MKDIKPNSADAVVPKNDANPNPTTSNTPNTLNLLIDTLDIIKTP